MVIKTMIVLLLVATPRLKLGESKLGCWHAYTDIKLMIKSVIKTMIALLYSGAD